MSVKVTGLTALNVKAVEAHAEFLKVSISKTTATFEGEAREPATRVRQAQEKEAEKGGRYASLHAVARKLENQIPASARLTLVADSTDPASLANIPGLSREVPAVLRGRVVEDALAKGAVEAADTVLKASVNSGNSEEPESEDGPVWGTAEVHGLIDGENFDYYGKEKSKRPVSTRPPSVRRRRSRRRPCAAP